MGKQLIVMNQRVQDGMPNVDAESILMKLASAVGLEKLRWSLRRLHCPVSKDALVLEVGAGGNPYPRANVLLDAMENTIERNEQTLISDRPLVLGLCESLPFRDKSFDFVIASHVLEHTDDPERFLAELMRVGKAGYIETPEGWFEKMCPFTYHRLEVSNLNGKLLIRKKGEWKPEEIALLWDNKLAKSKSLFHFLVSNPDLNHMRFYWEDSINFEIVNPDCDAGWPYPEEARRDIPSKQSVLSLIRGIYLSFRRWLYSQNSRNKQINVYDFLMCPNCASTSLNVVADTITCNSCSSTYLIKNGVPRLFKKDIAGFNRVVGTI